VEGYTNPKISHNVGEEHGDLIEKGNRELLCTLFESVAVLGRPEEVASLVAQCCESACLPLRQLMSGLLVSEEVAPDMCFTMTLLMAACSTNSIQEACAFVYQWQDRGFLPPLAFLYSLVLEALAGSIDGTSQRHVCDQMPSLPFRGFLRVRHFAACLNMHKSILSLLF
jgi:hypothetical protein